jgi:hypothetical protein
MGTKDFVLISERTESTFVKKLFEAVKELEGKGWTCEIKFSTAEGESSYGSYTVYSALIHAYEE